MMRYVFFGFLCGAVVFAALLSGLWTQAPERQRQAAKPPPVTQPIPPAPRPEPPTAKPPAEVAQPAPGAPDNEGVAVSITGAPVDAGPDPIKQLVEEVNKEAAEIPSGETPSAPQPDQTQPPAAQPAPATMPEPSTAEQTLPAPPAPPGPARSPEAPAATRQAVARVPDQPADPAEPALEKKIGQMLIFGFQGTKPGQQWPATVARQLADGTLGGVIFLRYNLASAAEGRRLMRAFHDAGAKADLPPLFVLDQEGGRVQRLAANVGVRQWPSASLVGKLPPSVARKQYDAMAAVVKDWGFNVNLGPVVDVNVNRANPVIGQLGRSYSPNPDTVVEYSRAFIDAHRGRRVLTALKHFPGHGSSQKDSHLGFTDISRTWQAETELLPYRELIKENRADMVMIGHLYLDKFHDGDPDKYPATLSPRIVSGLLRQELGYNGVVISDDMEMGAIRKLYPTFEAATRAIKAGIDLLIVSNSAKPDRLLPTKYISEIARAARADPQLRARIDQSYRRIVNMKKRLRQEEAPATDRSTQQREGDRPPLPSRTPGRADIGSIPVAANPQAPSAEALAAQVNSLFAVNR